jgi:replicative DNA helicase
MGIQPHELVVCAGWQGTGKSTLMQFIAFNAYLQGFTPLFISLEMEHKALLRKFDTMAVDMNYHDLKALELGDESIDRWAEWAERAGNHKDNQDIIIVDRIGARTATGVFAETVRYNPDLVVVDYISLLDAPKKAGDKSWQQIGHISRELKLNAQTLGIPVVAAAQTNRDSTKEGVKLETIAFSSSIGMDADIVLGLNQDDDMRLEEKMEVVMVKSRDSGRARVTMDWKMETMQFGERPPDVAFRRPKLTPPPESQSEPEGKKNPFLKGK